MTSSQEDGYWELFQEKGVVEFPKNTNMNVENK